ESVVSDPITVSLPADLDAGTYFLGVVMDPSNSVSELDEFNNAATFAQPFMVGGGNLQVISGVLPGGFLGAPYCEKLKAAAGAGGYRWSLAKNSDPMPFGLNIREEPSDAKAKGLPFESLLCGVPQALGSFHFTLQVASGSLTATGSLSLTVGG